MPGGLDGGILGAQGMFGSHAGVMFSSGAGTVSPAQASQPASQAEPVSQVKQEPAQPAQPQTQIKMEDEDEEL